MTKEMCPRHKSRELAFQILYGTTFTTVQSEEELRDAFRNYPQIDEEQDSDEQPQEVKEPEGFAWELVFGVWSNKDFLDTKIRERLKNWSIDRIGHIELTLLRLAFFELFIYKNTPPKVIRLETFALAKKFAELSSRKFIIKILEVATKSETNANA